MFNMKFKILILIFSCIASMNLYAGVESGKVAVLKTLYNGNVLVQLYGATTPSVLYSGNTCLVEDLGRGLGTVFQIGVNDPKLKIMYPHLLEAQLTQRTIKFEFQNNTQNYCFIDSITSYLEK